MKLSLKGAILSLLPENVLKIIKRYHYLQVLKNINVKSETDLEVLKHLVQKGDQVLDIGANIGVYTKFFSELIGEIGQVYSIEPIPLTFDLLSYNVEKLQLKNVRLGNYAISEQNSTVTMDIPLYKTGGENYYEAQISSDHKKGLKQIKVTAKSIDHLLSEIKLKPVFIKCDVEGHELQCIKGAINTIKRLKPGWLIEISGNPDDRLSTSNELFNLFLKEGYLPYWYNKDYLKIRQPGDKSVNYFFLTQKHIDFMKKRDFSLIRD